MKSKATLMITAVISALFGAFVWFGISNSDAQPTGAKQLQFVITGEGQLKGDSGLNKGKVERFEDPEYGVVCYLYGMSYSCIKK